jgi:2-dehydro-3-deoxyphosphogluconate aldolase/(4S)-4-hydroxy-2-oxoglutarate aldolase
MKKIFETLYEYGIIPVATLDRAEDAVPVARALAAGGLPVVEITFRTAAAADEIRAIAAELPDFTVGAGTVLTPAQAYEAVTAGAKFVVSPGTNPAVVEYCQSREVPVIPGCATATEIEGALHYGLEVLKFFPAEQLGGIAALRAVAAPYKELKFMPTGGISTANLVEYITDERVLAVGGTFMTPQNLIAEGRFDEITRLAREALFTMFGFSLAHIGINCADAAAAESGASLLAGMFGLQTRAGDGSMFAGSLFELMKSKYYGANGHIGIATNTIERAMKYILRLGYEFEPEGLKYTPDGRINVAYIKGDFAGFALHLSRRPAGS